MAMWAMAFPALVCSLFLLALVESAWRWFTGLGVVPWLRQRTGRGLSNAAFDEFTSVIHGTKATELEQRRVEATRRDDEEDGAPPHSTVDLAGGTAFIVLPREEPAQPADGRGDADRRD